MNSIQDLFPYFDPDKFFIGVRRGALSSKEYDNLRNSEPFMFNGTANDFVILPKSNLKEQYMSHYEKQHEQANPMDFLSDILKANTQKSSSASPDKLETIANLAADKLEAYLLDFEAEALDTAIIDSLYKIATGK